MVIKTREWPDIVAYFDSLSAGDDGAWLAPMRDFVRQIAASPYAKDLYPYTTMQQFAVAQTSEIFMHQERLMISFDPGKQKFRFAYTDKIWWGPWATDPPSFAKKADWYRETPISDAYPCFLKFCGQIGWIPELKALARSQRQTKRTKG